MPKNLNPKINNTIPTIKKNTAIIIRTSKSLKFILKTMSGEQSFPCSPT